MRDEQLVGFGKFVLAPKREPKGETVSSILSEISESRCVAGHCRSSPAIILGVRTSPSDREIDSRGLVPREIAGSLNPLTLEGCFTSVLSVMSDDIIYNLFSLLEFGYMLLVAGIWAEGDKAAHLYQIPQLVSGRPRI